MKKTILSFFLLIIILNNLSAQTWHVSPKGNDANDGKTAATAFKTLQHANDVVKPGDVVLIGNGNYSNEDKSSGSAVLNITNSGTKDAWIAAASHRRSSQWHERRADATL